MGHMMKVAAVLFFLLLECPFLLAAGGFGDLQIRPAPPAPPLPPKGGIFTDPTYGTAILRVTDRTDGAHAGHAYSIWSPFNADSTRFLIKIDNTWTLYNFDPVKFSARKAGAISTSKIQLNMETAQWHPTNPNIIYALEPSNQRRRLFALDVTTGTPTLVYDFSNIAPLGGYPNSLTLDEKGQVLAFYTSTTGGQDKGDFVVAYDLQTKTVYSLDFKSKTGLGNIHSTFLDKSGEFLAIHAGTQLADQPIYWIWNIKKNTTEILKWNKDDSPGGHWGYGSNFTVNPAWDARGLIKRSLSSPRNYTTVFKFPLRDGLPNYQLDSHRSWVNVDPRFFFYSSHINSVVTGWVLHSETIYKRTNFRSSLTGRAPEGVYANGLSLTESDSVPSGPAQWHYDPSNDTLYVWLPNDADATSSAQKLVAFAWWPLQEEIFQVWIDDPTNQSKTRRLAHHHSHLYNTSSNGYRDLPKAATERSGQYVMFDSNWGGSGHVDVFILKVPEVAQNSSNRSIEAPTLTVK